MVKHDRSPEQWKKPSVTSSLYASPLGRAACLLDFSLFLLCVHLSPLSRSENSMVHSDQLNVDPTLQTKA